MNAKHYLLSLAAACVAFTGSIKASAVEATVTPAESDLPKTTSPLHYTVKGEMADAEGKKIFLMDYADNSYIDSTEIKNGRFIMEGYYPRDAFVRIECGYEYANCVLDSLVSVDFKTHVPVSGSSRLNDIHKEFIDIEEAFYAKGKALRDSCLSIGMSEKDAGEYYREHFYLKEFPKLKKSYYDGILKNPNGIGEALIMVYSGMNPSPGESDVQEWNTLYASLSQRLLDYKLTKNANRRFEKLSNTLPGKPFVDFSAKTIDGKEVKLSDYVGKGKYVLVDFWASWCGPCRQEAKETLIPLYDKYKDNDNFEILGVAVWDKPERTLKALEQSGYPWTQMIDAGMKPMDLYGFDGIPQIILFNPDGTIAKRDLRGSTLTDTIDTLLQK